jgi:hypothetical protein
MDLREDIKQHGLQKPSSVSKKKKKKKNKEKLNIKYHCSKEKRGDRE